MTFEEWFEFQQQFTDRHRDKVFARVAWLSGASEADEEIAKLREERDAARAEAAEMSEAAAAMSADLTKIGQQRDEMAATVDFLRNGMDGMGKHNASVKWHLDKAQDPATILAARDARAKSEAIQEIIKWCSDNMLIEISIGSLRRMADAIVKGGA